MPEEEKRGTPWRDDELDLIVADYFSMLASEIAKTPDVKSRHSSALMAIIGRSHRSVEFKHQNISAVLDELGLPWIPGYKPKLNYQNAIFEADLWSSSHPQAGRNDLLNVAPRSPHVSVQPIHLQFAELSPRLGREDCSSGTDAKSLSCTVVPALLEVLLYLSQ